MDETFPSGTCAIISPRTPPQGRAWGRGGGHRAGAGQGPGAGAGAGARAGAGAGAGATGRGQGQATPPAAGQKLVQEDGTYPPVGHTVHGGRGKPRHLPLAKNPFRRTGHTVHVWAGPKHAISCTNPVKSTIHLIGLIFLASNSLKKANLHTCISLHYRNVQY